jgi:hypothetical protein
VVPCLIVLEGVVAEAHIAGLVDVNAAPAFAQSRALCATCRHAPGAACGSRIGPPRSSWWWPWPHGDLLVPVNIGASGFGMVICVGLLELELLAHFPRGLCCFPSLPAVRVASARGARGIVEDGTLDSSHEPGHDGDDIY